MGSVQRVCRSGHLQLEGITAGTESTDVGDAHQRKIDAVLVWKIDRFGWSLKHLVNSLADLSAYRVAFISLRDNFDLSTPSGRLMFQIIGAMAEFERSLIQERVRAGLRNAKLKGKTLGRPRRIVNGDEMARLREQGASFRAIAQAVGASAGNELVTSFLLPCRKENHSAPDRLLWNRSSHLKL
jgi:resolvase-like protein